MIWWVSITGSTKPSRLVSESLNRISRPPGFYFASTGTSFIWSKVCSILPPQTCVTPSIDSPEDTLWKHPGWLVSYKLFKCTWPVHTWEKPGLGFGSDAFRRLKEAGTPIQDFRLDPFWHIKLLHRHEKDVDIKPSFKRSPCHATEEDLSRGDSMNRPMTQVAELESTCPQQYGPCRSPNSGYTFQISERLCHGDVKTNQCVLPVIFSQEVRVDWIQSTVSERSCLEVSISPVSWLSGWYCWVEHTHMNINH